MGIIENTKEIAELIKKMGNIELYKRIVELEGEIIELSREKHQLEVSLHDVKKQIAEEESMEFRKPFVYKEGDSQPYCPKCWEVERKAVHLDGPIDAQLGRCFYCFECKNSFYSRCE